MAALNTVVDYFADEIRQGIALVVIWKSKSKEKRNAKEHLPH